MPTPGSCKLCESVYATIINRLIEQDKNEADVKRVMLEIDNEFYWTRQTFYAHKKHITHPLVSAAKRARENAQLPKTSQGFLEMVRDHAAQNVLDNPESVKLRDGIKAAEILEKKTTPKDQVFIMLAKAMTLQLPEEAQSQFTIEGEYRVLGDEEEGGQLASYETGSRGRSDADLDHPAEGRPQEDRQEVDGDHLEPTGEVRYAGG